MSILEVPFNINDSQPTMGMGLSAAIRLQLNLDLRKVAIDDVDYVYDDYDGIHYNEVFMTITMMMNVVMMAVCCYR